jgi:hypothetical protein
VRERDPRLVLGYVLEIIFSTAVPLIDEHHFKELIRRGIKEYFKKNDFNPLPISRDFDRVSWRKFNHGAAFLHAFSIVLYFVYIRELVQFTAGTVRMLRFS